MTKHAALPALERAERSNYVREIVTPEGIPLRFTIAGAAERAGAFLLDLVIQTLAISILVALLNLAVGRGEGSWLTAISVVLAFLFTTFYFAVFEVRGQGMTPGKRMLGIRVIDGRGGQLETSAVLARNLIREIEIWTPLRFLLARDLLWPTAPWWATLLAASWAIVFMCMPLFNRDRLRIGDMIAGTRVVVQPKLTMVPDLVDEPVGAPAAPSGFGWAPAPPRPEVGAYQFSDPQLGFYGIYELQVLEGVLRTASGTAAHLEAVRTVAEKIRNKIGYVDLVADDERFLRDFYAAQRAHLERKMLFGQRREDKFAR